MPKPFFALKNWIWKAIRVQAALKVGIMEDTARQKNRQQKWE
jgi:hypothetical protein